MHSFFTINIFVVGSVQLIVNNGFDLRQINMFSIPAYRTNICLQTMAEHFCNPGKVPGSSICV